MAADEELATLATEEIGARINRIRGDAASTAEAIVRVGRVIDEVSALQTGIAGAVEEQAASTREISINVSGAAEGAGTISVAIEQVAASSQDASTAAAATRDAADRQVAAASELLQLVAKL